MSWVLIFKIFFKTYFNCPDIFFYW
jgi:hypothetical protein